MKKNPINRTKSLRIFVMLLGSFIIYFTPIMTAQAEALDNYWDKMEEMEEYISHPRLEHLVRDLWERDAHNFRWYPQEKNTLTDLEYQFLETGTIAVFPHLKLDSPQELQQTLLANQGAAIVLGNIRSSDIAGCESYASTSRRRRDIYLPEYKLIDQQTMRCFENYRLHLGGVTKITTKIKRTDVLDMIVLSADIDPASVENIREFSGAVVFLGKHPPDWFLEILNEVSWYYLALPSVKKISPEDMELVARFSGSHLELDGLRKLRTKQAQALSGFQGHKKYLKLENLELISSEALHELTLPSRKYLHLGLSKIPSKYARSLHYSSSRMYFSNLETISLESAKKWTKKQEQGRLDLGKLSSIEPEVLTLFLKNKTIFYVEFKELNPDIIQLLWDFQSSELWTYAPQQMVWMEDFNSILGHVERMDGKTAKLLMEKDPKYAKYCFGLTEISPEVARILTAPAAPDAIVDLSGLRQISEEVLEILASFEGETLRLDGLEDVNIEQARILALSKSKQLELGGLRNISPKVASALAEYGGRLSIPGYLFQDLNIQRAFAGKHPIPYQQLKYFDDSVTKVFANVDINGIHEHRQRIGLSPGISRELHFSTRSSQLRGLSATQAEDLAQYKGKSLTITLFELTPQVAQGLGQFQGSTLSFEYTQTPISAQSLQGLAQFSGNELRVRILGDIQPETLTALAQFKGNLLRLEIEGAGEKPLYLDGLAEFENNLEIYLYEKRFLPESRALFSEQDVALLLKNFQGKSLQIAHLGELTAKIAESIVTTDYPLHLSSNKIEEKALDILGSSEFRPFMLELEENPDVLCWMEHIESGYCLMMREQDESLYYRENQNMGPILPIRKPFDSSDCSEPPEGPEGCLDRGE